MFRITEKLLAGSGVTTATHPVLVSLLELAAQKPGIDPGADEIHALRKRLERQWGAVCTAFRSCLALAVSDKDVLASAPGHGLAYAEASGWALTVSGVELLGYRKLVAEALQRVAEAKPVALQSFVIKSVADLRKAQKVNRIRSFSAPVLDREARTEGAMWPGRLVIVSWPVLNLRVFALLQSDEFGQVTALVVRDSKKKLLRLLNP